ncbi:MAG: ester cyclase [Actinomycetota bacterium]
MRSGVAVNVQENEAELMRAVEAWNSGDVDSYMELYAKNIKLHAGTYDFPDRKAVESMYKGFHAATTDLRLEIHETFGQADTLAARYSVTGTHTGELMGMPPTGREISMTGITIMHFEDRRVVERWDSDDSAEVLSRLRAD